MSAPPVYFNWDGESMTPATPYMARLADKHYVVGETYSLIPFAARSAKSHNHFFASVADAWSNLPDDRLEEYPSAEHLRKKALIRKGYCDERSIVCASKAEAQRVAAFIKPLDDYAIVIAKDCVVTVYTAKSQSAKAMGAQEFGESKKAVFEYLDALLGVPVGQTKKHAGKAA
jgi:hypothetical protein